MTIVKEPNPPFPVEIIDVVPTEVANPFTKQKATLQPTAIAVYDCIKGAEMLEDFDIVEMARQRSLATSIIDHHSEAYRMLAVFRADQALHYDP